MGINIPCVVSFADLSINEGVRGIRVLVSGGAGFHGSQTVDLHSYANMTRVREGLGFQLKVELKEGLKLLIDSISTRTTG